MGILDAQTLAVSFCRFYYGAKLTTFEFQPLLTILRAHEFPPTALRFNPSGALLASASADNTLRVIAVPSSFGQCRPLIQPHFTSALSLCFSYSLDDRSFDSPHPARWATCCTSAAWRYYLVIGLKGKGGLYKSLFLSRLPCSPLHQRVPIGFDHRVWMLYSLCNPVVCPPVNYATRTRVGSCKVR